MSDNNDAEEPPEWAKRRARELANATVDGDETTDDGNNGPDADEADADRVPDVPVDAVDEAERLTRLAREAADPDETEHYRERRDSLADDYGYTPRVRDEDDTLVLYPDEWVEDGTVRFDRIEDTDRAVEVSLSGPGDADRYRAVAAYNDAVVDEVAEIAPKADVETHAATARSFAAFMSNHYVRTVDDASPDVLAEFREEYFPRNGWPTDEQRALLDRSLDLVETAAAEVDDLDS
ncbi:DUF7108 domain-containing protein [Halorubrum sp. DTA98]|uniref:DUF7108 domain-containing protein n=1 Tax=Halorubrum sp. DTA98 TaxID=3402163 RepID=UPI003AB057F9